MCLLVAIKLTFHLSKDCPRFRPTTPEQGIACLGGLVLHPPLFGCRSDKETSTPSFSQPTMSEQCTASSVKALTVPVLSIPKVRSSLPCLIICFMYCVAFFSSRAILNVVHNHSLPSSSSKQSANI